MCLLREIDPLCARPDVIDGSHLAFGDPPPTLQVPSEVEASGV